MRNLLLLLPFVLAALVSVSAQPVSFTGLETAREATAGPATRPTSGAAAVVGTGSLSSSVPAGQGMQFGMTDRSDNLTVRKGRLVLMLSRTEATFSAAGSLPVALEANVTAQGHADATGRLRLDSQKIVDELLSKSGSLPALPGGLTPEDIAGAIPSGSVQTGLTGNADASFQGKARVDNIQASAEIGKKTEGILVGVPIVGGLSFFGGARRVQEYVVVAVQGFDYSYAYSGQAGGSVTEQGTGTTVSDSRKFSGSGGGRVKLPGVSARSSWEYTVAVVGVGYRGESGGFHAVVDLDFSAPKIDPDGYIDLGPLQQLQMPGPVRDIDVGGDFRVGGFSAGANVKLFTFAGYAAGASADLFVSQEFSSFDIGLSYHGKARALMADQSAALELGFKPREDVKVTLIAGVRVLSSYMPAVHSSTSKDFGRSTAGSFGGASSNLDYSGSYNASASGSARVIADQDAQLTNVVTYAPGIKVDLLSRGVSLGGGPILDHNGKVIGGRASATWEVVKDRMELEAGGFSAGRGNSGGMVTLGVSF